MQKTTKLMLILSLMTVILLLSSCANGGGNRKVSVSQLKEDISNNDQIQACFMSEYVNESMYSVESIEIIKEQINEKEIITYSNVVLENDYFSVPLYVKTVYNFYEHGGWIMDELYIEEIKEITPISGPEKDLVHKYLAEHYSLSGITDWQTSNMILDKAEFVTTESVLKDTTSAHVYATYQTDTISVNGYVVFSFTTDGWINEDITEQRPNYHIVDYTANYSKALGKFEVKNDIIYKSVEINIISIEDTFVTFEVMDFNMPGYSYNVTTGSKQTAVFDPMTGSFDIGSYIAAVGSVPLTMVYKAEYDTWNMLYSTLSRQ